MSTGRAADVPWEDVPINVLLTRAHGRAEESLAEAGRLLSAGFPDAAFVWAVRSLEIYTKEFLLAPLYLNGLKTWPAAVKAASKLFGSSNWKKGYARLESLCGPIDEMLTVDHEDAWRHWETEIVGLRGDIVHGRDSITATDEYAELAIAYAGQLMQQLTLRMIVSGKHPMSGIFSEAYRKAYDAHWGAGTDGRHPDEREK